MKPKGVVRLLHGRSTQFAKLIILYQNDSSWILAIIESWNMFKAQTSGQSLKILCSSRNNKHLFEIPCQWMRILDVRINLARMWKCRYTWSSTQEHGWCILECACMPMWALLYVVFRQEEDELLCNSMCNKQFAQGEPLSSHAVAGVEVVSMCHDTPYYKSISTIY